MSRYVKKADREAQESKERLRAGFQKIADDPQATNDQKLEALSKLADLHIAEEKAESKAGPLREEIDRQAKQLRDVRAELVTANEQLVSAQARIAECEKQNGELATERNGLRSDVSRLGVSLSDSYADASVAHAQTGNVQQKLTEANKRVDALALNLRRLVPGFKAHYVISEIADSFIAQLFFELGDSADRDLFVALGFPEVKFDFWQGWLKKANRLPSDKIIDLLHRSNCSCTQHEPETRIKDEGVMRPLTSEDREFLLALLNHRKVETDIEIGKLQAAHRELWQSKNRPELRLTPPVSHREFTPFASTRVVHWGED